MIISKKKSGFTILEILVTLIILSLGILSISHITGNALSELSDNEARSMALHAAAKDLEPLYIAANISMNAFKDALEQYDTDNDNIYDNVMITQSNSNNNYTLLLTAATDSSKIPKNLLFDEAPNTWNSPITVGVKVIYKGKNATKIARAPFVFIVQ